MAFFRQLGLLMCKHFLQHWRKLCATVLQILIPLIFAIIFMALRFVVTIEQPSEFGYGQYTVYGNRVGYFMRNTVVYTPNNTLINSLMVDISKQIRPYPDVQFIGFRTSADMLAYFSKHPEDIANAIEFMDVQMHDTVLPKKLHFTIRPRTDYNNDDWRTYVTYPSFNQWVPRRGIFLFPYYKTQGFLELQRLVHDAIIRSWNTEASTFLGRLAIQLERMPYPSYVRDRMIIMIQDGFPVLLMLSFLFIAVQTPKDIVDEKEKRLKESMKLMGMNAAAYWTSWFLFRFLQMTIVMALFTFFCCVDFSGKGAPFPKSDPSLFFIFLECYGVAIISYSFMVSVFVQKASNAAAMSGVLFFFSYFPYFYISYAIRYRGITIEGHQGFCLVFNLAMAYGAHLIALYEGFGTGVQWSNFHQSPTAHDNFALLHAMLMLLLDSVIYLVITWYVANVRPGEYGVPKPWHFPVTAVYQWCRQTRRAHQERGHCAHGISIQDLRKVFQDRTVAVNNVNLNVRKDEITVLIGPNGGGKTTTVSLLAGLIIASEGTATVNGYDINTDIEKVRESLSLCPQHNVLFDTLTVKEHLKFFACLKGVPRNQRESLVKKMIDQFRLSSEEDTQSQHLSGGQRRKLSMGIALLGDSRVVILDEPTSGMDPKSRHEAWDILQQNREGRTILLTTQSMDEAQYLGQRIAIMAEGAIKCFDTPHNLNSQYWPLEIEKLKGFSLELSRIKALLVKKFLHTWRNKLVTFVQLVLPLALICFGLAVAKSSKREAVPLTLDLTPFRGSYVPYWKGDESNMLSASFAKAYALQFTGTGNKIEDAGNVPNVTRYFLSRAQQLGLDYYNKKMVIGAKFTSNRSITAFYNRQPYHAEPISLSFIMNALLKYFTSEEYSITTIINPMPAELYVTFYDDWMGPVTGLMISFCAVFGIACLTSPFVYLPIKEREVGAKHLQLISGVRPLIFWASTYMWDYINYIIPVAILMIVFGGFQIPAFIADERLGVVLFILLLYGLDVLPFMYTLQYMFKSPASGMATIIIASVVTGMATLLLVRMLTILDLEGIAEKCDPVFSAVFSHYNFGNCFQNLYVNYISTQYCMERNFTALCAELHLYSIPWYVLPCCKGRCVEYCIPFVNNYWAWESPGLGRSITFMIIQAFVFMTVSICIENRIPQRIKYRLTRSRMTRQMRTEEDADVANERQRVENIQIGQSGSDLLVLKGLSKRHGNIVAVDDISVGISEGECFGLIGLNGAGKTSTFKMLTGDMMLTVGNAYLGSYDIKNNTRKFLGRIGYCPQFDAHIDHMTGRETLTLYARLNGVPTDRINDVLDALQLQQYADKRTSQYSGGNKRKLSTAVALVGDPAVVLLDEPSTGMDPNVRTQLWNVLSQVRSWGRTILLTSHSMEECEALCTRLAIMVNAHLVCLGSPQQLKTKYGQGYAIMATGKNAELESLIEVIKCYCPETRVPDSRNNYVSFFVPASSCSVSLIFTLMENAKAQMSVEDYSIQETTLEQVFLDRTQSQVSPTVKGNNMCIRMCCRNRVSHGNELNGN